ncbi:MAG: sterol desaturase family protein [Bacteroidota bacterium]
MIGNLGWFERIFITPTHHGVHHASNPKYLNKNYGDIFIFWDKLFGTFQTQEEKPVYGLTHPLKSHSFLWQHFHYYFELWVACRRAEGFFGAMKVLFGKPEAVDQNIRPALERKLLPNRQQVYHSFRFKAYLNLQLIVSLAMLFVFTLLFNHLDTAQTLFIVTIILLTLVICGAMLEQRRWVYYLEVARCLVLVGFVSFITESYAPFIFSVVFFIVVGRVIRGVYNSTVFDIK